ncbi:acyl transferase domain-containing protein [Spinactinospora alkalitolerans]|uniref:Acyl transferase domain-containing protein n=1 Tax=Spinactinospora alkalitolerans TaxID=687207 RepID=A0A852U3I3_9ACTN|nr:type I polyketide synthase [Spinactinospora alkalitolerans]NYE50055.1 acyl transferase domain-containing protein [Spinactinospora alkalitolerans]
MKTPKRTAAITGIGCRLPGGVRGPQAFWDLLVQGRGAVAPVPASRWKTMRDLLAPEDAPVEPWQAGTIDIDDFDHGFFGISAEEAAVLDAQQRLLLETVVEALYDAGLPLAAIAGGRTGVYVGSASVDHAMLAFAPGRRPGMLTAGGAGASMLAARTAHALDVHGPALTIDTACSSSLVAAHYARRDLESGEIDTAIVAGTNLLQNPLITRAFNDGGVLSPTGRCRPFDAQADGYVRSEAIAAVILQRLDDTGPDRDRAYALLRGSAVNSDGTSMGGLFAPSRTAQAALLEQAYTAARVPMQRVGFVEAHGTGTKSGDREEALALAAAFARTDADPLLIGSVKSNLGHTEGAAGIVGLIKAALIAYHGQIPATLHHTQMRPTLTALPLRVPTATTAWPRRRHRTRVVGVSSFGYGGTNAHVILTSAPRSHRRTVPIPRKPEEPVILPVSAHTPQVLSDTAADLAAALDDGVDLPSVAALATTGRDHHAHRAAVIATIPEDARAALDALAHGQTHPALIGSHHAEHRARTVFVFPGQGAHEPAMGAVLAARFPVFSATVEQVQAAMARYDGHVPWRPGTVPTGVAAVQQAIFTIQIALAGLWRSLGVDSDAVVGHSLGEIAAAHTTGALSLDDAARLVCARSQHLAAVADQGHLLATGLTREAAEEMVTAHDGRMSVAADNGPAHTVLTGPATDLDALHTHLNADGVFARRVPDSPPAHSPLLDTRLESFAAQITGIRPKACPVDLVSTVTTEPIPGGRLDAAYWTRQLRDPVELHAAIRRIAEQATTVFVEITARSTLAAAIEDTLAHHRLPGTIVAPGVSAAGDEHARFLAAAAELFTHGHAPAWPVSARRRPAELPPPRWHHHSTPAAPPRSPLAEALSTAPPDQRRAILVDAVHASVTSLLPDRMLTIADRDTELDLLGIASRDVMVLRERIRRLHPTLTGIDAPTLLHAPTVNGITDALLPHLSKQRSPEAAHPPTKPPSP